MGSERNITDACLLRGINILGGCGYLFVPVAHILENSAISSCYTPFAVCVSKYLPPGGLPGPLSGSHRPLQGHPRITDTLWDFEPHEVEGKVNL